MLIAHLFIADDRMTVKRVTALIIGFIGDLLLLSRDLAQGDPGPAKQPGLMNVLVQAAVLLATLWLSAAV